MSLAASDVQRLVATGAPVLCVDTCSILDVMRDPTRDGLKSTDFQAALDMIALMEANGPLACLLAEQVQRELNDNAPKVEEDAKVYVQRFKSRVERLHSIAGVFAPISPLDLRHLDGHVDLGRVVFDRWVAAATPVPQKAGIGDRAIARVMARQTPAQPGKESAKDCVVIETYLDTVAELRNAGLHSTVVFLSSNTKDYTGREDTGLNHDLLAEFGALGMLYASSAGYAKHLLQV
jgi:hypothetical protein